MSATDGRGVPHHVRYSRRYRAWVIVDASGLQCYEPALRPLVFTAEHHAREYLATLTT